jgi:3-deoxy-D-manno-octulosonic-acid transferase
LDLRRSGVWRSATISAYHVVFAVAFLFYLPVLAWRCVTDRRYRAGLAERVGAAPRTRGDRPVVWIHGVSVGEIKAAGTLIRRLRERRPELELVLSSTTPAGNALARQLHPELRVVFYPLDFGPFPGRALDRIRPAAVLLVELEIWPMFLEAAAARSIPVAVINGRISEQSFRGYRRVRGLLPQFDRIALYCVQDEAYRERLRALGVAPERIHVTGNMKYDSVRRHAPTPELASLRAWLSPDGRSVVVGGSTHADEELLLARALAAVRARRGRPLRLVLAPRHPERAPAVREQLDKAGFRCMAWSGVGERRAPLSDEAILLVDRIGLLEDFYGACDVAFVGGSLVRHGGQNMLEPAAYGRPVLVGPHTENFRTDVQLLVGHGALVQVPDVAALVDELDRLLADPSRGAAIGGRALEVIERNHGATERTLQLLEARLLPAGAVPDRSAPPMLAAPPQSRRPTGG